MASNAQRPLWTGLRRLTGLRNEMRRKDPIHVPGHAEKAAREHHLPPGFDNLCARTAHEMSTPLTTIGLVLGDLRRVEAPPPDWKQNIDLLWGQVQICKRLLTELALANNVERLGRLHPVSAKQLVHDVGRRFQLLRPTVQFKLRRIRIDDSFMLKSDDTLSQALLNLLKNAADASPHSVELRAARKNHSLVIQILNRGPGVAPPRRAPIGGRPTTTPPPVYGSGAGVLVAQAVIGCLGGTVQTFGKPGGGTCVQIELPMSRANWEKTDEYREPRIASG